MDNNLISLFNSVRKVLAWHDLLFIEESYMKWAVYYLALIHQGDRDTSVQICERLELSPRYQKIFCRERFQADRCLFWLERHVPVKNSSLYRHLWGFRVELILYMMAATRQERVKKAISHFYTRLRTVEPRMAGKDLHKLGFQPGPIYREILQAVQDARLNGRLKSRQDELEFVKRKYVR